MRRISRQDLAEEYQISVRTVDRLLKEIEAQTGRRYPRGTVIRSPRVRVSEEAAHDYMINRTAIQTGTAPAFERRSK